MFGIRLWLIVFAATLAAATPALAQHRFIGFDAITIPQAGLTTGTSTPYPDRIPVTGVRRPIGNVRVVIHNLSHTYPDDLDIVLVSPRGLAVVLMSDAGGSTDFSGTFRIEAGFPPVPDFAPLVSGEFYSPADHDPGDVPPGLPAGLTFTTLEGLRGTDANGYWSLYVFDDASGDIGVMNPPELEITEATDGPLSIGEIGSFTIFDQTITRRSLVVSGQDGPIRNIMVRVLGLSHAFPSDLDIGVIDPTGQLYVLMSDAGGLQPVAGIDLEFVMGAAPVPLEFLSSGRYAPTNYDTGDLDLAGANGTALAEGRNAAGVWTLIILDDAVLDAGSFQGWGLIFNPPCAADFNRNGLSSIQDVFDFLTAWFAGCP